MVMGAGVWLAPSERRAWKVGSLITGAHLPACGDGVHMWEQPACDQVHSWPSCLALTGHAGLRQEGGQSRPGTRGSRAALWGQFGPS